MRIASIDIGTNTVLLLIADAEPDGTIRTVTGAQRIIRLGKNVDAARTIRPEGFDKCAAVLIEFRTMILSHQCEITVACGTSALRDAANREEFIAAMEKRSGIRIEILSGGDEALWTFQGGRLVLMPNLRHDSCTVIDIGGGSTEFIVGTENSIGFKKSVDIGAVRLTERFVANDPILHDEEIQLRLFLRDRLREELAGIPAAPVLIGTAGTVTTVAAMLQELETYDPGRINGFRISIDALRHLNDALAPTDLRRRKTLKGLQPERADVILAGSLILEEAMAFLGKSELMVSDYGLRYGLILRELDQKKKGSPV